MLDCPVEQGDHVLMARSSIIVEPHEALSRSDEGGLDEKWQLGWKLFRKVPG